MVMLIPVSAFAGKVDDFVYLYSAVGGDFAAGVPAGLPAGNYGDTDGFQEWATVGAVPIPGAVWLFGSGLLGLLGIGYSRRKRLAA